MITFTQLYAVISERSSTNASGPHEERLWRHLVDAVLSTDANAVDVEPPHPSLVPDLSEKSMPGENGCASTCTSTRQAVEFS